MIGEDGVVGTGLAEAREGGMPRTRSQTLFQLLLRGQSRLGQIIRSRSLTTFLRGASKTRVWVNEQGVSERQKFQECFLIVDQ